MKSSKEDLGDKIYELELADLELEGAAPGGRLEKAGHEDKVRPSYYWTGWESEV